MSLFQLEAVGGPWARRLARRRAGFDAFPWDEPLPAMTAAGTEAAMWVWTQSAFSEYASAAAFAEIASCLLACGAPIDLVAAAGDFVVDEILHAELCARMTTRFGGAVPLEVDLTRLSRPPSGEGAVLRAAELVVRVCCVGETLTLPILKVTKASSRSPLVQAVVARIARDESAHAQLGPWFLDWAAPRLGDADRAHLGEVAGSALRAFAPIFGGPCAALGAEDAGVLDCATYDRAFADAVKRRVVAPLAERGIVIAEADLVALPRGA